VGLERCWSGYGEVPVIIRRGPGGVTAWASRGSPEKPGKRELYFRAGASEFWVCDESGRLSFYGSSGQIQKSALCPGFPDKV